MGQIKNKMVRNKSCSYIKERWTKYQLKDTDWFKKKKVRIIYMGSHS